MATKIRTDWSDPYFTDEIDFTCPYCYGEGEKEGEECEYCTYGYIEPMYNYSYLVDCECSNKNRKIAYEQGLFLYEHPKTEEVFMSLMGCGMDLSPQIMAAYLKLTGHIPVEWATCYNGDDGYFEYVIGKELLAEVKEACIESFRNAKSRYEYKLELLKQN